jgi:DNA-directed RNA polymerase specialized sigma24 family protein
LPSPQQANCSKKVCNVKALASIGQGIHQTGARENHLKPTTARILALASQRELSDFLTAIERRAFKQAMFAVRNEESALDVVQDAMMKLAEKYGDHPLTELPMLFQRILQNTIRDYYRRSRVRALWTTLLSSLSPETTRTTIRSKPSAAKPDRIARRPRTTSSSNRNSLG